MSRSEGVDEQFSILWSWHPRKKSKGDALKAWIQTAKIRPEFPVLMQAHARARRDWSERDIMFVPYLASWLRAHGWEDEPDPEPTYDEIMARRQRKAWG